MLAADHATVNRANFRYTEGIYATGRAQLDIGLNVSILSKKMDGPDATASLPL